jgi:hypothetical protein
MNKVQLKEEVRRAISQNWDSFVQDHPNLARVIDQELLVEGAIQSLADDPEYLTAMEQSHAIGIGAQAIVSFVDRFVVRWFKLLV